jgi:hypothetical protein
MKKIVTAFNVWVGANGATVEVAVDGAVSGGLIERGGIIEELVEPRRVVGITLLLETGEKISIDIPAIPNLLPDRTGVICIFSPGDYVWPGGGDVFEKPQNAIVVNSDGSIRFQINASQVDHISLVYGPLHGKFEGMVGLLVSPHPDAAPEMIYALDPSSPDLISTGLTVRY